MANEPSGNRVGDNANGTRDEANADQQAVPRPQSSDTQEPVPTVDSVSLQVAVEEANTEQPGAHAEQGEKHLSPKPDNRTKSTEWQMVDRKSTRLNSSHRC